MSEQTHYIGITVGRAVKLGSCNACSRHTTAEGITDHQVTEIHLHQSAFRLCDDCLRELKVKLHVGDGRVLRACVQQIIDSGVKVTLPGGSRIL